ncbi:MAG: DNA-processing protein DprA [Oscillospiraceae bacterium]
MKDIGRDEIIKLLFIVSCFGAGNPRIYELAEKFGSFDGLYKAIAFTKPEGVFTEEELKAASRIHGAQLRGIISYCKSHNIGIISCDDEEYPKRLKNIYDPPVLLFFRGDVSVLKNDMILAVVGSRKISDYSAKAADIIAGTIAANGITVASGFAVGTDITAHLSAVRNGGKTIAVLGCGIDYAYPAENMQYADRIAENGVFISEYPPNTAAQPRFFIARNRILAGISIGTAVIEAAEKSGSLNTASYTLSQGKDLWVVPPHDIFNARYDGGKALLSDGAIPIYSPDDILGEYFENYRHKPVKEILSDYVDLDEAENRAAERTKKPKKLKADEKTAAKQEKKREAAPTPGLDGSALIVYNIIKGAEAPISADEAAEAAGMDISEVLSVITELEIEGLVSSDTGQTYYAAQ